MSKVINMLGISEKIEEAVNKRLQDSFLTPAEIKVIVKMGVKSYASDLYTTMRELEMYKYKFTELEVRVGNLAGMIYDLQEKGGG